MNDSPRFRRGSGGLLLAFAAAAAIGFLHAPHEPSAQSGPRVSADSILTIAKTLTGDTLGVGPHTRFAPLVTTGEYAAYVRDRLAEALAPMQGEVVFHAFGSGFGDSLLGEVRDPFTNVVGTVRGNAAGDRAGFYLLGAHFDATAQRDHGFEAGWRTHPAPGADDNASGVAVMLEAARVFAARGLRPDVSVVFAFFDAEEQQVPEPQRFLLGSGELSGVPTDSLVAALGPLHGFVNADMIAYNPRQDSLVVMTNLPSRWLADRLLAAHADAGLHGSLLFTRAVEGLTFSDHGPYWERGYDAVLLIEATSIIRHAPHYHRATDTVANTYLRGGSQARKTAEVLVSFLDGLTAQASRDSLVVTGEDILVQRGVAVDLPVLRLDEAVEFRIGVTNVGATRTGPWTLRATVEADGTVLEELPAQAGPAPFATGARAVFRFAWTPGADAVGAPVVRAVIGNPGGARNDDATRRIAVEGESARVVRAYVYPNPTRLAGRAVLHYELARPGSVRASLLDMTGRRLAEADLPYDRAEPIEGTGTGGSDLAMETIFPMAADLAPGVYLVRVELFDEGKSVDVALVKWAVLR